MYVRWKPSRAVPVAALALFLIITVLHWRLRNGNVSAHVDKTSSSSSSSSSSSLSSSTEAGARGQRSVGLEDVFIAVKSTRQFHRNRLELLLDTWISKTKEHTFIFTDATDEKISSRGFNLVVTSCSPEHTREALSCKMAAEYDHFMATGKRWLCHVDDDNYLNPGALLSFLSEFPLDREVYVGKPSLDRPIEAQELLPSNKTRDVSFWFATGGAGFCLNRKLAEKMAPWASGSRFKHTSDVIRLPDDCVIGFIVERRLGVSMIHSDLFHSHLENLLQLTPAQILTQVTLSYGLVENKMNSVRLKGGYSTEEDPSRFKTLHCFLYPLTSWCP